MNLVKSGRIQKKTDKIFHIQKHVKIVLTFMLEVSIFNVQLVNICIYFLDLVDWKMDKYANDMFVSNFKRLALCLG